MTFCLPIAFVNDHKARRNAKASAPEAANTPAEPLLGGEETSPVVGGNTWREVFMLSIPTFFDLVATILMNVGLLSVTASVYQMLRGAEMLFAALFAVFFLKRSLNKFHYRGIGCCIAGITLVGVSSLLSGEGSASHEISPGRILFGMTLIVLSQAVQAAQITFEDFFMADMAIPPLKIVGYEGLFGSFAMVCVLLPIVQRLPGVDGQGIHEDSLDTWHMVTHSSGIARILALDMVALLAYNVAGMCVTGHLGAVFRTVLETTRTLFVWLVDLMLFYTPLGLGKLGESWNVYSWVQMAGFCVLVAGTVIYGKGDEAAIEAELAEGGYDAETGEEDRLSTSAPRGKIGIFVFCFLLSFLYLYIRYLHKRRGEGPACLLRVIWCLVGSIAHAINQCAHVCLCVCVCVCRHDPHYNVWQGSNNADWRGCSVQSEEQFDYERIWISAVESEEQVRGKKVTGRRILFRVVCVVLL